MRAASAMATIEAPSSRMGFRGADILHTFTSSQGVSSRSFIGLILKIDIQRARWFVRIFSSSWSLSLRPSPCGRSPRRRRRQQPAYWSGMPLRVSPLRLPVLAVPVGRQALLPYPRRTSKDLPHRKPNPRPEPNVVISCRLAHLHRHPYHHLTSHPTPPHPLPPIQHLLTPLHPPTPNATGSPGTRPSRSSTRTPRRRWSLLRSMASP